MLNENESRYLRRFYDILKNNMIKNTKIKYNSLFLSIFKIRENTRFKIFLKSTISSLSIPNDILNILILQEYVKTLGDIYSYVITAKGIWYIENNDEILNNDLIINFVNKEYFNFITKNLTSKEKVILLSLIASRSFSVNSAVDLKKDDYVKDKWKEIIEKSYEILFNLNVIHDYKDKIISNPKNVHLVSSLFRHNNDMTKKTQTIYAFNRKQEYYLNIYFNDEFHEDNLSYLFYLLFEDKLNNEVIDSIIQFCNDISKNNSIYLFDALNHIFSLP